MLWLAIYLPQLPLEVFEQNQQAFAITENIKQRSLITYHNIEAAESSVENGINRTLAQSLCPAIYLQERKPELEQQALNTLANWAYRYSPNIYFSNGKDRHLHTGLLIEISSSLKLFKGLDNFIKLFIKEFSQFEFQFQYALSGNSAIAKLASIYSYETSNSSKNKIITLKDISYYPLSYLQLEEKTEEQLSNTGIRSLQDLLLIKHADLGKQFPYDLLNSVKILKSEKSENLKAFKLEESFSEESFFISEIENTQQLFFPLNKMLKSLENFLHIRQLSIKGFLLELHTPSYSEYQNLKINIVFSQKNYQAKAIMDIIRLRLENISLETGVNRVSIRCQEFFERNLHSRDFFPKEAQISISHKPDSKLLDLLHARLGRGNLYRMTLNDEPRPELSFEKLDALKSKNKQQFVHTCAYRKLPVYLLNQPRPLSIKHKKLCYFGPLHLINEADRIETGWWDKHFMKRDYFIAQRPKGEYYWVYQDHLRDGQWFLHGVFS